MSGWLQVWFRDDVESAGAVGNGHEFLEPGGIDGRFLAASELEMQWDSGVDPDDAVAAASRLTVLPREDEFLVAAQLRDDDNFQVCECSVVDLDLRDGGP